METDCSTHTTPARSPLRFTTREGLVCSTIHLKRLFSLLVYVDEYKDKRTVSLGYVESEIVLLERNRVHKLFVTARRS